MPPNAIKNVSRELLIIDRFDGGLSDFKKGGKTGSVDFSYGCDIYSDPSYVKGLPRTTKDSGATVTGKIIDMTRVPNGDIYFIDTAKKFYKRTQAGTWSVIGTISGDTNGMGIFYWTQTDTIYITTDQSISTYAPVTGTPTLTNNKYGDVTDKTINIASTSGAINYPDTANIQGHWKLNESSGNRSDDSGNNNTLTDNNTVASSTDAKEGSRSADFEVDNSEWLSISDTSQSGLDITSDMTIACWIKLETQAAGNIVTKYKASLNNISYRIYIDSNFKVNLAVSSDGTGTVTTVTGSTALNTATWYHVAATFDASTRMEIFLDGATDGNNTTTIPASIYNGDAAFAIGARAETGAGEGFIDGLIDDCIIWDKDVADADITTLYNSYGTTYNLSTSVSENAADTFSFTPAVDPNISAIVNVDTVGTGDWTVVVHDDDDNQIATKTITNGSVSTGDLTFTFASNWRPVIGATYHIHITSTVADGKVTPGDTLTTKGARLVDPKSDAHPMQDFINFMVICNGRYIMKFDGLLIGATDSDSTLTSSWSNALTLPSGFEAICVDRHKEYLVFGCERRGDNEDEFSEGLLILWDGLSDSPNVIVEIPEGGVQLVSSEGGDIVFWAGLRGEIFKYNLGIDRYSKLGRLPKTTDSTYVRSSWACVTNYMGLTLFAGAFSSDNANFNTMAYAWGHKDKNLSKVLHPTWYPSHGNRTGTTREIGAIKGYGTELFIAWKDGGTYGVDIVESSSAEYAEWAMEGRIEDLGQHWHTKFIRTLRADHQPLVVVDSDALRLDYDIDQSGDPTAGTNNTTNGDKNTREEINTEFKDFQWKFLAANKTQVNSIVMDIEPRDNSELP